MPRRVLSIIVVGWLLAACNAASPSTDPFESIARPEPSVATAQPSAVPSPEQAASPSAAASPSPAAARWEAVADTPFPSDPEAVQLAEGRVLAIGWDLDEETDDGRTVALLWDPAYGTWSSTAALDRPRSSSAMIALDDGRALVVGGFNERDASYSSVYAYDPAAGTWAKAGVMHTARTNPAVARLDDGRILIAGGYFWQRPQDAAVPGGGVTLAAYGAPPSGSTPTPRPLDDVEVPPHGYALATAELFDPASGTFEKTGPMRYARPGAAITTLRDGRVLVVGASNDDVTGIDERAYETAEIFDPATGRFELIDRLPALDARALEQPGKNPIPDEPPSIEDSGTLVALADGGALLVAQTGWWKHVGEVGRSFRFDAGAGTWTEFGETYIYVGEPTRDVLFRPGVPWQRGVFAAPMADGRVLVAGGEGPTIRVENGYTNESSDVARAFDPMTDTWTELPEMPQPRQDGTALPLADGSVLILGGFAWDRGDSRELPLAVRFVPGP